MKTYAIFGAGGSFGIHTALYLLDHADPKKVIGVGRNPLRPEPFSLNVEKRKNYQYHAFHLTHELDSVMELLDKEKDDKIAADACLTPAGAFSSHLLKYSHFPPKIQSSPDLLYLLFPPSM